MAIPGIGGARGGVSYYNSKVNRNWNQAAGSLNMQTCITLKMTDEESGDRALTCVGFPDGGSVSVFKADSDTDSNPQYLVKYWDKNGEEIEYNVNPAQVNPENASYLDMLAYSTYLDLSGQTKDAFGDFLSASRGVNGNLEYDAESMNQKRDFKSLVNEFMQAQYHAGNIAGYLSLKRFYDCMGYKTESLLDQEYQKWMPTRLFMEKEWNKPFDEAKVSDFKEYETENYRFVPEQSIGEGGMEIFIQGESAGVFSAEDLKIRVDEQTGTRVLISEIAGFGGAWYDAIPVDAELERGLAEAMGVEDIPEIALEGYYIGTHTGTGIQYVMRQGDEGKGGKVLLRSEADVAKYNALAEEYYNRYPNLISSQEAGRIWASFEICGMAERTDTGIVTIGYDNISYHDNTDYKKNWSVMLAGNTWELLSQWLKENRDHIKELQEFRTWMDIFDKIGGSYEQL